MRGVVRYMNRGKVQAPPNDCYADVRGCDIFVNILQYDDFGILFGSIWPSSRRNSDKMKERERERERETKAKKYKAAKQQGRSDQTDINQQKRKTPKTQNPKTPNNSMVNL